MSAVSPYLGCKISLISKAEIRYEGLLYSIDAQESTVALANGWSCFLSLKYVLCGLFIMLFNYI